MAAKIPPAIVEAMRERIAPLDTTEVRENYRTGNFPRAETVKNLNKRYRWDLFWASKSNELLNFATLNESHIDTALRSVVPFLEGES